MVLIYPGKVTPPNMQNPSLFVTQHCSAFRTRVRLCEALSRSTLPAWLPGSPGTGRTRRHRPMSGCRARSDPSIYRQTRHPEQLQANVRLNFNSEPKPTDRNQCKRGVIQNQSALRQHYRLDVPVGAVVTTQERRSPARIPKVSLPARYLGKASLQGVSSRNTHSPRSTGGRSVPGTLLRRSARGPGEAPFPARAGHVQQLLRTQAAGWPRSLSVGLGARLLVEAPI